MRKFFVLAWTLLRCGMGNAMSTGTGKKKKKRNLSGAALWLLVAVCLLPMLAMLFQGGRAGYGMLAATGQEGLLLELICFAGGLVTLVFGLPYILTVFYMSGDIQNLLPLPLRPAQIVGAKFVVVWVYEILTTAVIFLPLFLGFGIEAGAGLSFWLITLIGILLVPAVPMAYAALASMIFMRLGKAAHNKSLLTTLGTILLLIVAMGVGMLSGQMGNMDQESLVALVLAGHNSLVGILSRLFPNLRFLVAALTGGGAWNLLIFAGITAGFVALFLLVASRLYFGGVLTMSETSSKRQRITAKEEEKLVRRSGVRAAYLKKEFRLLFRSPTYFLNCALMLPIWPFLFLVPMGIALVMELGSLSEVGELLGIVRGLLQELPSSGEEAALVAGIMMLSAYGVTVFIGSTNLICATAISREGEGYMFMKYIPLSYRQQMQAKLLSGLIPGLLCISGYLLVLLLIGVALGLPLAAALLAVALSVALNVGMNCFQLWRDLCRPKLTWENEQQAVKQNLNATITLFVLWALGLGLGALAVWLFGRFEISPYLLGGGLLLLLAALDVLLYRLLMQGAERKIQAYE